MSDTADRRRRRRIRRIAVALGREASDTALLDTLARFASESAAELAGLFVEDVDLLRLAQLPFAREISLLTSAERPLDPAEIERQLKVQAAAVQRTLASTAERAGVAWSFQVMRGPTAMQLVETTVDVDLLVLAGAQPDLSQRAYLHVTTSAPAPSPWGRAAPSAPVMVAYDRSASAGRALEVGSRLARADRRPLVVLLIADSDQAAERLRARAAARLEGEPATYRRVAGDDHLADLLLEARRAGAGMLVLGTGQAAFEPDVIKRLREGLRCPALLVR